MASSPPKFIFFDMGNVLISFDEDRAVRQMAEVAGVAPSDVRAIVYDSGLQDRFERGEIIWDDLYAHFCQQTQTQPPSKQLAIAGSNMFELNVPMVPLIANLSAAGHPLGILSNTCQTHWDFVCRRFTILRVYFQPAVLSFQVGTMKPAEAIYRSAIESVGLQPEEIFYMDDRIENVEAAKACGLDAVHFTDVHALAAELRHRGLGFNY